MHLSLQCVRWRPSLRESAQLQYQALTPKAVPSPVNRSVKAPFWFARVTTSAR